MLSQILRTSFKLLLISLFLISCSSSRNSLKPRSGKTTFVLKDRSGEFLYHRDVKLTNGEIATRITVLDPTNTTVPVEKTISISKIGITQKAKLLRPKVSQHTIWYDKEKYFSQLQTNTKNKTLDILMESPEKKWQGSNSVVYPPGRIFCFFTQIPECVKFYGMITGSPEKAYKLVIIWDNFPYQVEAFANIGEGAFQSGVFRFESEFKGSLRYKLELSNQIIFYEFDVNREFDKMYWIAQGLTLVRR